MRKTNLEKFEMEYNVLEPLFISKVSKLSDFDIREGDIVIVIRKKHISKHNVKRKRE
jgi:hypothetical protein